MGGVWPTGICFVIRVIIFVAITVSQSPFVIVAVGLAYGFTFWITAPLTVVFARQYCGAALLGTVSGLITMVHHGMGGLGAVYAAHVFDTLGSYDVAIWTMVVFSIVGVLLTVLLARYKS